METPLIADWTLPGGATSGGGAGWLLELAAQAAFIHASNPFGAVVLDALCTCALQALSPRVSAFAVIGMLLLDEALRWFSSASRDKERVGALLPSAVPTLLGLCAADSDTNSSSFRERVVPEPRLPAYLCQSGLGTH